MNLQRNHQSQCHRSLSEVAVEVLVLEVSDSHEGMLQAAVASLCNNDQHVLSCLHSTVDGSRVLPERFHSVYVVKGC